MFHIEGLGSLAASFGKIPFFLCIYFQKVWKMTELICWKNWKENERINRVRKFFLTREMVTKRTIQVDILKEDEADNVDNHQVFWRNCSCAFATMGQNYVCNCGCGIFEKIKYFVTNKLIWGRNST